MTGVFKIIHVIFFFKGLILVYSPTNDGTEEMNQIGLE